MEQPRELKMNQCTQNQLILKRDAKKMLWGEGAALSAGKT